MARVLPWVALLGALFCALSAEGIGHASAEGIGHASAEGIGHASAEGIGRASAEGIGHASFRGDGQAPSTLLQLKTSGEKRDDLLKILGGSEEQADIMLMLQGGNIDKALEEAFLQVYGWAAVELFLVKGKKSRHNAIKAIETRRIGVILGAVQKEAGADPIALTRAQVLKDCKEALWDKKKITAYLNKEVAKVAKNETPLEKEQRELREREQRELREKQEAEAAAQNISIKQWRRDKKYAVAEEDRPFERRMMNNGAMFNNNCFADSGIFAAFGYIHTFDDYLFRVDKLDGFGKDRLAQTFANQRIQMAERQEGKKATAELKESFHEEYRVKVPKMVALQTELVRVVERMRLRKHVNVRPLRELLQDLSPLKGSNTWSTGTHNDAEFMAKLFENALELAQHMGIVPLPQSVMLSAMNRLWTILDVKNVNQGAIQDPMMKVPFLAAEVKRTEHESIQQAIQSSPELVTTGTPSKNLEGLREMAPLVKAQKSPKVYEQYLNDLNNPAKTTAKLRTVRRLKGGNGEKNTFDVARNQLIGQWEDIIGLTGDQRRFLEKNKKDKRMVPGHHFEFIDNPAPVPVRSFYADTRHVVNAPQGIIIPIRREKDKVDRRSDFTLDVTVNLTPLMGADAPKIPDYLIESVTLHSGGHFVAVAKLDGGWYFLNDLDCGLDTKECILPWYEGSYAYYKKYNKDLAPLADPDMSFEDFLQLPNDTPLLQEYLKEASMAVYVRAEGKGHGEHAVEESAPTVEESAPTVEESAATKTDPDEVSSEELSP